MNDTQTNDTQASEVEGLPGTVTVQAVRTADGKLGVKIQADEGMNPFAVPGLLEAATSVSRRQMGLGR